MQVFKVFFKITKKKLPSAIIYIGVFFALSIFMSNIGSTTDKFEDTKLDVCIIDEDNTEASKAITDYISKHHNLVDIENNKDEILDAVYYERANYILTIKKDYENKIVSGQTDGLFTNYQIPGSYTGTFLDNTVNEYISVLSSYIETGNNLSAALNKTSETMNQEVSVTKEIFSAGGTDEMPGNFGYYFQYLPYVFLGIFVTSLCPILLTINNKDVKNRTDCSSISLSKQTFQIFLGSALYVLAVWFIFMIGAVIFVNGELTGRIMLAMLNSLVFVTAAAAITLLISVFAPSENTLSLIGNVVSLGMSFVCGIFVPQSLLSDSVLNIGKFLPAFWYVKANNMIAGISGEVLSAYKYSLYIGIQLLFVIAILSAVLLISKLKTKTKH